MADEKVGPQELYAREYNTSKERQLKFYTRVEEAVNDPDPRLRPFVTKVSIELLGEIKLVLVPVVGEAVRALVTTGLPKDAAVKVAANKKVKKP